MSDSSNSHEEKGLVERSGEFKAVIDRDRESRSKFKWKGALLDYLEVIKKNPGEAQLAHSRIYSMLTGKGVIEINTEEDARLSRIFKGQKIRQFGFFADKFFGMENTVSQVCLLYTSPSPRD